MHVVYIPLRISLQTNFSPSQLSSCIPSRSLLRSERESREIMEGGDGCFDVSERRAQREEDKAEGDRVIESSTSSDDPPPLYLPPGYRFHPEDDELIRFYLLPKVRNIPLEYNHIKEVNLYDYNPEDLTAKYKFSSKGERGKYKSCEKEWYFFTPRQKKYKNGSRPNRAAGNGYWKATGADKPIVSDDGETSGVRKALVFYEGKPPKGIKSNWIMHEFRIIEGDPEMTSRKRNASSMRLDDWVLCRIYENPEKGTKESQIPCPRDCENESPVKCQTDLGEQMENLVEESSYGNQFSIPEVSSEIFNFSGMPITLSNDSVMSFNFSSGYECLLNPLPISYDSTAFGYNILMNHKQLEQPVPANSILGQCDVGIIREEDEDKDQLNILRHQLDLLRHGGNLC